MVDQQHRPDATEAQQNREGQDVRVAETSIIKTITKSGAKLASGSTLSRVDFSGVTPRCVRPSSPRYNWRLPASVGCIARRHIDDRLTGRGDTLGRHPSPDLREHRSG